MFFKTNLEHKNISIIKTESKENKQFSFYEKFKINFNSQNKNTSTLRLFKELESNKEKTKIISNKDEVSYLFSSLQNEINLPKDLSTKLPKELISSSVRIPSSINIKYHKKENLTSLKSVFSQ